MADNTTLNAMTGGDVIRDINRSGVKTQVVQLDAGGESGESLVSAGNPLPMTLVSPAAASAADDGTITDGGTPQALFGGATPANGYEVLNPNVTSGAVLYVSDHVTDPGDGVAGSIPVLPGGSYRSPPGYKPQGAVYIASASTGAAWTASAY